MVVREKASADSNVHELSAIEMGWPPRARGFLDRLPKPFLTNLDDPVSLGLQTIRLKRVVQEFSPDVLHFHWVNGGMVSIRAAASVGVPAVWTLHDMWAFTGGCHYAGDCTEFRESCRSCPKVKPWPIVRAVPHWVHARKSRLWGGRRLNAIAPSQWMATAARESSLFANADVRKIGYCFDPAVFRPDGRQAARQRLGLPLEKPCVLFVNASQPRKGAAMVGQIMDEMSQMPGWKDSDFLFAGGLPTGVHGGEPRIRLLPATHDEAVMAEYFAAADLFVMPSLEDNLPNVIIESLACGTPVAAFAVGGISEMITEGQNGCLSAECTVAGMAQAIARLDPATLRPRGEIAADARTTYSQAEVSRQHVAFYRDILHGKPSPEGGG
jgi:glycosyltransferase involved in cell wall biosynthesis